MRLTRKNALELGQALINAADIEGDTQIVNIDGRHLVAVRMLNGESVVGGGIIVEKDPPP
jgi:hypothetical protein